MSRRQKTKTPAPLLGTGVSVGSSVDGLIKAKQAPPYSSDLAALPALLPGRA